MKKHIAISLSVLVSLSLKAQVVDLAYIQCNYSLTYAKDSLQIGVAQTDEMMLLIGNKYSFFCSYINYTADSLQKANPAEYAPQVSNRGGGAHVSAAKTRLKRTDNVEVYLIEKASNRLLCMGKAGVKDFYSYSEQLKVPEWEMHTDFQEIAGYKCQKATTFYGGRAWTAWFAADIPVSDGPWELRGLPGLILKVEDSDKQYIFTCSNVGRLSTQRAIEIDRTNSYREITKKEFIKERKQLYEDPLVAFSKAGLDISAATVGNPSFAKPRPKKYNPIEVAM